VLLDHLPRVHPVHVVGAEHDDVVGLVVVDQVQALVDGVRAAGEPARAQPLLRRHRGHVVAQQGGHPPGGGDVPVQRMRLVLGQHADPQIPTIDQIGQNEVDQPVVAAERDRRLGAVGGERPQPLALTAGEHDPEHAGLRTHVATLPVVLSSTRCMSQFSPGSSRRTSTEGPAFTSTSCPRVAPAGGRSTCTASALPGTARWRTSRRCRWRNANPALQTLSADLSIADTLAGCDVLHSHTWYANFRRAGRQPAARPAARADRAHRWSRSGRGRSSSSAAATGSRPGWSGRRMSPRTR